MNYPLISEYIEAIKSAEDNFEELSYLRPVLDDDGLPVMTSGNFAVVFKMKDDQNGKFYAVKCFTKEQEGRAEAYREIAKELEKVSSPYILSIRYLDKELFVDTDQTTETEFPVLLMDWVEGKTLDKYLRENLDDKYALEMLAYRFSQLAQWLIPQPYAHGDLKPDNILVREDGTLVLVDYDGMYVPAMKGQKARDLGSPDFRHPLRTENEFDKHIDDFSIISILLSLYCISIDCKLYEDLGLFDGTLLHESDYVDLANSNILRQIIGFNNKVIMRLYAVFVLVLSEKKIDYKTFLVMFNNTNQEYNYKLFKANANWDDKSKFCLSCCLRNGIGCEQDVISGLEILGQLAEQNDSEAQSLIGSYYERDKDVQHNYEMAVQWYTKAAEQGNSTAQCCLASCYYRGKGVSKNYEKAVEWFSKAANQGNTNALYSLGVCYYHGKGFSQDYEKAVELLSKAANQGHPTAQGLLGYCYYCGKVVPQNYDMAMEWYLKAVEQGDATAQCLLGLYYYEGKCVPQNCNEAFTFFTKAAEQGNAIAQLFLGTCYYSGKGVAQNQEKGAMWYTKAAEQGIAIAQCNLASCYYSGNGITQNYQKAVEWYLKAAEQGNAKAQYNLGYCYENGIGIIANIKEAGFWYKQAAQNGNLDAQKALEHFATDDYCFKYDDMP